MTFQCHACEVPLTLDEARAEFCLICGAELDYNLDLPPAQRRKLELGGAQDSAQFFVDPPHTPWPAMSQSAWHAASSDAPPLPTGERRFVLVVLNREGVRIDEVPLPVHTLSDLPNLARRLHPGRYVVVVRAAPKTDQFPAQTNEQKLIELDIRVETNALGESSEAAVSEAAVSEAAVSVVESSGRLRPLDDSRWQDFWRQWESLCASLDESAELVQLASTASLTQTATIGVRHQRRDAAPHREATAARGTSIDSPHPAASAGPSGQPSNTRRIDSAMAAFGKHPQSKAARLTRWISRRERDR